MNSLLSQASEVSRSITSFPLLHNSVLTNLINRYRKGVPNSYVNTFNNSELHGFSPFREIQLLIDNNLAGVSWPFPIVFTGGINPGLWRPIVGINVFDIPTFEIDISPWLGLLCDGKEHIFQLKAVGFDLEESGLGTVGENWWVTGSVFIWEDKGGSQTTGKVSHDVSLVRLAKNIYSICGINIATYRELNDSTSQKKLFPIPSKFYELTTFLKFSIFPTILELQAFHYYLGHWLFKLIGDLFIDFLDYSGLCKAKN